MSSASHDFVTVDMRGLKAALVARAQAQRVSVSVVVRRAVARELGSGDASLDVAQPTLAASSPTVKLSLRVTVDEATRLDDGARRAGLSRGAYIAGLVFGVRALLATSPSRPDCLTALTTSTAELSTLIRNIHHLTALLRQGDALAAAEYLLMLVTLRDDVRAHLSLAASVLADLRPARARTRHADIHPSA